MRIAAVVVTYNRCALLIQCIEHLRAQKIPSGYSLDVLVIDNASTDDTLYMLTPFLEDGALHYYNTGANLGGAGGFAYGMRAAVQAGFDLLWVMDDDCLPSPSALAALIGVAESASEENGQGAPQITHTGAKEVRSDGEAVPWGYISSVVQWKDGSPCAMNIQRHPLFKNIEDFSSRMQPCTLASFVSLLVPACVVREVGLPYAEFFIWTDDWEFTRRISRMYPCYVAGESKVMHASATNSPGNIYTDSADRLSRYEYIYRNDGVLYRAEGLRGKLFLWVRALYHTLRVLTSDVDEKKQRIGIIWRGTREGFSFNPKIEYPV